MAIDRIAYDIETNYETMWVIVRNATSPIGQELQPGHIRDAVRRRINREGVLNNDEFLINDQTSALESWESRRTRKPFTRPKGMFIFKIVSKTNRGQEMNEWPVK